MPEITVMAAGAEAGGHLVITVAGEQVKLEGRGKGLSLIVIDHLTKEIEYSKTFDTSTSADEERQLFGQLKKVAHDKIVVMATNHDGAKLLKSDTKDLIGTFGSKDITNLRQNEPWAFVGGLSTLVTKKEMKRPKGANNFAFVRVDRGG